MEDGLPYLWNDDPWLPEHYTNFIAPKTQMSNQGVINGLWYDDNGSGAGKTKTDLMWSADMVKVGLAGSIRDYPLLTFQNERRLLREIDYNGQPAGYVSEPAEVVKIVERLTGREPSISDCLM